MIVYVSVQCGVGKEQCEDTVLAGDTLVCAGNAELSLPLYGAVCIADGVGGNAGGQFASSFVTTRIKNFTASNPVINEAKLKQELEGINAALIYEGNRNGFSTTATTLSGIVYSNEKIYLVHIGNTRVYVMQGNYLKQLTTDHTVFNRLLKMGRIDDASKCSKNEITNCFGGGKAILLDSISVSEIQEFSTLLLTSDGVHDYIGTDELEHLLTVGTCGTNACQSIVQAAFEAGSKDDISAVIIKK